MTDTNLGTGGNGCSGTNVVGWIILFPLKINVKNGHNFIAYDILEGLFS